MAQGSLKGVIFRVKDAEALAKWYETMLGMAVTRGQETWTGQFQGNGARLVWRGGARGQPYQASRSSVYWKIGLALRDVDLARDRLLAQGLKGGIGPASQFLDIGYLTHLADPAGFSMELLQTTFQQNFVKSSAQLAPELPLGQQTLVGQVTLRCSDIDKTLAFYADLLGMKLLSIQEVTMYNFTLYFLAFTDEEPPGDLKDVGIREWLWQRPYTTLELQHRPGLELKPLEDTDEDNEGVEAVELAVGPEVQGRLEAAQWPIRKTSDNRYRIQDPDGIILDISIFDSAA